MTNYNVDLNNCWIDPNGKVYPVTFGRHGVFANQVLGTDLNLEQAVRELAKLGWLHVGFSSFVGYIRYVDLSDVQSDSLYNVLERVTSGNVRMNILSYIHS